MDRFRRAIKDYAFEILEQSLPGSSETLDSIEAYINHHRDSTGAKTLISQCEYVPPRPS